jgi:hypothetical protein
VASSDPAPVEAAATRPPTAQPTPDCQSICAAELASSRDQVATHISEEFEACPSELNNDRVDCIEGVNAQLATATEQVDAAFAACNDGCARTGEPYGAP